MTIIYKLAGGRVIVLPPGGARTMDADDVITEIITVDALGRITGEGARAVPVRAGQKLTGRPLR